ncbi:MAG: hypothetical protein KDB53_03305 [Planctomycetes bacterium]|nr:hypothetical protein [Planctomycetota bacterium]
MTKGDRTKKRLKGSGGLTPSPSRVQATSVDWFGTGLPFVEDDEYGRRVLPVEHLAQSPHRNAKHRDGLPLMIAFTAYTDDIEKFADYESLWSDEHVGVVSRFFNCYRLALEDMDPEWRKRYGGDEPRVVFLDAKGQEISTLDGWNVDSKKLLRVMDGLVRQQWEVRMAPVFKQLADILATYDEVFDILERERRGLTWDLEHVKVHDCNPARRRIERRKESIAEAEARQKKAEADEAELFAMLAAKSEKDKASPGQPAPSESSKLER